MSSPSIVSAMFSCRLPYCLSSVRSQHRAQLRSVADCHPAWEINSSTMITSILSVSVCVILLPFLAVVYLVVPESRVGRLLRSPFMKFLNHSASFAIFLVLLLLASTDWGTTDQRRHRIRGPKPDSVEVLIVWWVLGESAIDCLFECVYRHIDAQKRWLLDLPADPACDPKVRSCID